MRILSMINTKLSDDRFLAKLLDMPRKKENKILLILTVMIYIIRGEPERAPNTRGTGSGFICIYICMYVCGVIISVRRVKF